MALTFEIQRPLSTSWVDITAQVADSSLELERTAWSDDFGHAPDLLRARLRYDPGSDLGEVLWHADRRVPVRLRDGPTVLFRGAVMPTIRQAVEEVVGDVELEVVDQSWRLDRDCTSFAYQGYKVFDPSNTTQSIIHQRLVASGFEAAEIDDAVSITATVAHVARNAGDETELSIIAGLLKEYGYVIHFRPDGLFSVRPWRRSSVSATQTFDATNMRAGLTIERREISYEAVEIEWSEVGSGYNYLVYREHISENREGEFKGIVILPPGGYFPPGSSKRAVWQEFRTEWIESSDEDTALLAVTNPSLVYTADDDIEVVTEVYEPLRGRVVFRNIGSNNNARLWEFDIRGDVVFRRARHHSSAELRGRSGSARGGTSTTIILDAEASTVDDYYTGLNVEVDGVTRRITDYVGDTQTATVNAAWTDGNGDPATPANGAKYRIFSGTRAVEHVKADYIFDSATAADYAVGLRDAAEYGRLSFQFRVAAADAVDPGAIVRIKSDTPPIDVLTVVTRRRQILESPDHPLAELEAVGVGPLRRDDALEGDTVMSVVPASIIQRIDETKITPEEVVEGFDRGGGTTTPAAPVLQAWASGRAVRLTWDRQYLLTNLDYYELQVSQDGTNWYSLQNDGDDWADTADATTRHDAEEYRHVAIPLDGTDDYPSSRTLSYRVRRVTRAGDESAWSNTAQATAHAMTAGDLAGSIVSAAKIDPQRFLRGLDEGLDGYWSLDASDSEEIDDEEVHFTRDNAGLGRDLTINGTPTVVTGVSANAYEFADAQTTDYLIKSNLDTAGFSQWSLSVWLRLRSLPGTVVSYWVGGEQNAEHFRLHVTATGAVVIETRGGSTLATAAGAIAADGAWHHLVALRDTTAPSTAIWIDGTRRAAVDSTSDGAISGIGTLVVGQRQTSLGGGFNAADCLHGAVDEMRLYRRTLSEGEIRFLFMQPVGPQPGMIIGSRVVAETLLARHIHADTLNALVFRANENLRVGDTGWTAGSREDPTAGDLSAYLDRDEVALERHDGTNWIDIVRVLAGGSGAIAGKIGSVAVYDRNASPDRRAYIDGAMMQIAEWDGTAWKDFISLGRGTARITHRPTNTQDLKYGWIGLYNRNGDRGVYLGWGSSNGKAVYLNIEKALELVLSGGHFRPSPNNTLDLGTSSHRWRNLYAQKARIYGDLTVDGDLTVKDQLRAENGVRPHSVMHTNSNRSYNNMYDWLSPALPANGDRVLVNGGSYGTFGSGRDHLFSYAWRSNSSNIVMAALDYSPTRRAVSITYRNGRGATVYDGASGAW